jgi:GGDEF domain-containing protein
MAPISKTIFILSELIFVTYAIIHLFTLEEYFFSILLDLSSLVIVSSLHLYLIKSGQNKLAIILLIITIILNTNLTLYLHGIQNMEFIWLFVVPLLSFLITGKKRSIALMGLHISLFSLIYYLKSDTWHIDTVTFDTWINIVALFVIFSIFLFMYEQIRENLLHQLKDAFEREKIHKSTLEEEVQKRTYENLKLQLTDPLTKLPNKLAFQKEMREVGTEVTLLLLDINHFTDLTYTYGEATSNKLFKEISHQLTYILPKEVKVYRYHKQFIITFSHFKKDHAQKMVNKIFVFFRASLIEVDEISLLIDFTIGIAHGSSVNLISYAEAAIKEARVSSLKSLFYEENSEFVLKQKKNIT